jgi:hypothetical protein
VSDKTRAELAEQAARLLRNHVAGENVDDLMHYWADEWDAIQTIDLTRFPITFPEQEPEGAPTPDYGACKHGNLGYVCGCKPMPVLVPQGASLDAAEQQRARLRHARLP